MIYFVESSRPYKSGYLCQAMELDRAEPFDIGIDAGWRLWMLGAETKAVSYKTSSDCASIGTGVDSAGNVISCIDDIALVHTDFATQIRLAAGAFVELFVGAELGAPASHFFLSSHESAPTKYRVTVKLAFENLSELPDVQAALANRKIDAGFSLPSIDESSSAPFVSKDESSGDFLNQAMSAQPCSGLWLPFDVRYEGKSTFGALCLERASDSNEFMATAYVESDKCNVGNGIVLHRSVPWVEDSVISADMQIGTIVSATRSESPHAEKSS